MKQNKHNMTHHLTLILAISAPLSSQEFSYNTGNSQPRHLTQTQTCHNWSIPLFVLWPWSCLWSLLPLCSAWFCCSTSHSRAASESESPPVQSQTPCTETEQRHVTVGFSRVHYKVQQRVSLIHCLHSDVHSHLIPVGLCRVSVHTCFGFVDKVAKGIHLQRAVKV